MKKFTLLLSLVFCLGSLMSLQAQIDMPQPSPNASVMQAFGISSVTITYSAPGVKGRTVWGELVPYGEKWRAGANAPTRITFGSEVEIAGKKVPKGEYTLMVTPNKGGDWTFLLNEDKAGNGVFSYNAEEDVLSFSVKPEFLSQSQERLAYYIRPLNDEEAEITLRWEKVTASFKVKAALGEAVVKNAQSFLNQNWFNMTQASQYLLDNNGDLETAAKLAETAMAMRGEHFVTLWMKAQVLAKQQKNAEAKTLAEKAKVLGEQSEGNTLTFYNTNIKEKLEASLKSW
ncbi:MAG: DUF2911 domain-containing protein [Bacteroidota bacterium]